MTKAFHVLQPNRCIRQFDLTDVEYKKRGWDVPQKVGDTVGPIERNDDTVTYRYTYNHGREFLRYGVATANRDYEVFYGAKRVDDCGSGFCYGAGGLLLGEMWDRDSGAFHLCVVEFPSLTYDTSFLHGRVRKILGMWNIGDLRRDGIVKRTYLQFELNIPQDADKFLDFMGV